MLSSRSGSAGSGSYSGSRMIAGRRRPASSATQRSSSLVIDSLRRSGSASRLGLGRAAELIAAADVRVGSDAFGGGCARGRTSGCWRYCRRLWAVCPRPASRSSATDEIRRRSRARSKVVAQAKSVHCSIRAGDMRRMSRRMRGRSERKGSRVAHEAASAVGCKREVVRGSLLAVLPSRRAVDDAVTRIRGLEATAADAPMTRLIPDPCLTTFDKNGCDVATATALERDGQCHRLPLLSHSLGKHTRMARTKAIPTAGPRNGGGGRAHDDMSPTQKLADDTAGSLP